MKIPFVTTAKYNPADLVPVLATAGSAAVDIRVAECVRVKPGAVVMARTGLSMEIPQGYVGLIVPRSGLGTRGLILANTVGVIDSDYRGEIMLPLHNYNRTGQPIWVEEGTRAAQMMIVKVEQPEFVRVTSLSDTERGSGGFGHTGD